MNDYDDFLEETGVTEAHVRSVSEDMSDHIDLPPCPLLVKASGIEGRGLFSEVAIDTEQLIAPMRLGDKRTIAGRFSNHSPTPNAEPRKMGDNIWLVALEDIDADTEITVNYRDSNAILQRERIMALESAIMAEEQVELEVKHTFANGVYAREMIAPKDVILTGKIHRYPCINIVAKGKFLIVTEEGEYEAEAPYTFVSGAGVKKAMCALEDSVFITVHPWEGEEDLDAIDDHFTVPSFEALEMEQRLIEGH